MTKVSPSRQPFARRTGSAQRPSGFLSESESRSEGLMGLRKIGVLRGFAQDFPWDGAAVTDAPEHGAWATPYPYRARADGARYFESARTYPTSALISSSESLSPNGFILDLPSASVSPALRWSKSWASVKLFW